MSYPTPAEIERVDAALERAKLRLAELDETCDVEIWDSEDAREKWTSLRAAQRDRVSELRDKLRVLIRERRAGMLSSGKQPDYAAY